MKYASMTWQNPNTFKYTACPTWERKPECRKWDSAINKENGSKIKSFINLLLSTYTLQDTPPMINITGLKDHNISSLMFTF